MKSTKKLFQILSISIFMCSAAPVIGQEFTAGINTETPNPNAVLHLVAPNGNQGLLIPSLTTTQRTSMSLTATDNGLMVFDSDINAFFFWVNPGWVATTNTDNQDLANVLGQNNDAGGVGIENVADPVNPQDVATKNYVDTRPSQDPVSTDGGNILLTGGDGGAFLGNVDFADVINLPPNLDLDDTDDLTLTTLPAVGDISGDYSNGFQINPGVVSSLEITDGTISNADLGADAVQGSNILDGTILNADIADVAVGKITGAPNLDLDETDDLTTADIGTAPGNVVTLSGTNTLPALDGSALTGVTATIPANSITGTELANDAVGSTEILDGSITDIDIGDVSAGKVTGLGTSATLNVGTADLDVVQVQSGGFLPPLDGSNLTNVTATIPVNSITGTELANDAVGSTEILDGSITDIDIGDVAAGKVTGLGTSATQNVGVADGNVVQVQTGGLLPALDGSNLTNVTTTNFSGALVGDVTGTQGATVVNNVGGSTAVQVNTATTVVNGAPNLDLDATDDLTTADIGTAPGNVVTLSGTNTLPALDGSALTGVTATIPANSITDTELANDAVGSTEILDGSITDIDIGDVSSVKVTGLGTSATLDVGVADLNVVQVQTGGLLPALDGSNLTNITTTNFSGTLVGDVTGTQGATVVNNVGGSTAAQVSAATTVVNGAPNLDLDGTDDLTTADVGTAAGNVVTLFAVNTLPALDGSALTDLDPNNLNTPTAPSDGNVLTFNAGVWDAVPSTSLTSGNGITINTNFIDLGGTLSTPANITTGAGGNDLIVDGAGRFTSNAAIETNLNSPVINLGDAAADNINVTGGITFNEATNNLLLDVSDQTGGPSGILVFPDLGGNTETIALLSDLTPGLVSEPNATSIVGGTGAGAALSSGTENTIYGINAASGLTTGTDNVIFGTNAAAPLATGSGNTIIGSGATASGPLTGNGIAIGRQAEVGGSNSIALGFNTVSTGLRSVAIGSNTNATLDRTIVLGDGIAPNSTYNVGIGTNDPRSALQIGGELGLSHFENVTEDIFGDAILSNVYPDYTNATDNQLRRTNTDSASFIFFEDGEILFLNVPDGVANSVVDISDGGDVRSWMEMRNDGNIDISEAIKIGSPDPGDEEAGMIQWTGSDFEGNTDGSPGGWVSLTGGGFSLPFNPGPTADAGDLFFLQQTGVGGAGRFQVSNATSAVTALAVESNGAVTSRAMHVVHTGAGDAGEFSITGGGNGAAIQGNTDGTGVAGSFAITNASNTSNTVVVTTAGVGGALSATINNATSTGSAIFASTNGTGSVLNINHTGTNGNGVRIDMNSGSSAPAIEILNSNGPSITTDGAVGIGTSNPNRELHLDNSTGGISLQMTNSVSGPPSPNNGFVIDYNDTDQRVDFRHYEDANIALGSSSTQNLIIDNTNNRVGIGTATPGAKLDVNGSVMVGTTLSVANGANFDEDVALGSSGANTINVNGQLRVVSNFISPPSGPANDGFIPASRIIRIAASANINNIAAGADGQEIILITDGDATFNESASIDLVTSPMIAPNARSTLHLVFIGSRWTEISRTIR
ncbi:beta strand repeat-containing protein [Ekhidna sp.]